MSSPSLSSAPAGPVVQPAPALVGVSRTRQWAVLLGLFVAWAIAYTDRIVIGTAIIPIAREFGLDDPARGYVLGAFYLSYAAMQLGGGWLADRYGARRVLVGCLLLWSVFTALTGAAWSFASLLGCRLLFGLGEGSFAPANARAITETFPAHLRGRVQALLCSTVFLGSALGAALIGWTIAKMGWRVTFPLLGALGLLIAVAMLVVLPARGAASATVAPHDKAPPAWRDVLRVPMIWRVAVVWFGSAVLSLGLQSWMPSWLMQRHGVDLLHIGFISAIPFLLSFLGTNVMGQVIDRIAPRRLKYLMAAGALLSAVCLLAMTQTAAIPWLVVWWTVCMLGFDMVYATVFAIPLKCFAPSMAGRTTGLINFCGQMAGFVAPVVMGHLIARAHGSYFWAFVFLVGCALMASVVALRCDLDNAA